MRALVVTNMQPSPADPGRGSFVRDQVRALRALGDPELELETFDFPPGGYIAAGRALRRRFGTSGLDVVHAHFGLTAWPSLAAPAAIHAVTLHGTDVRHPRSRELTRAVLPFLDLVATVSAELESEVPRAPGRRRTAVLPCGVAVDRFRPLGRAAARAQLGLDPDGRYLLFSADPARPGKRHDLALALAERSGATLLTLGHTDPEEVPLWVNGANAVVVPSDREGFGLAVLEALACDVRGPGDADRHSHRSACRRAGHALRAVRPGGLERRARAAPGDCRFPDSGTRLGRALRRPAHG